MYEKLFSEGHIGKLTFKNRLVMSPMGIGLAELDGTPSEDMIAFYKARAAGGAADAVRGGDQQFGLRGHGQRPFRRLTPINQTLTRRRDHTG